MLADGELIRSQAVEIVLSIRKSRAGELTPDNANPKVTSVRKFIIPEINVEANFYHNIVDFDRVDVTEPPATKMLNDETLKNIKTNKLELIHPCHNQAVERHVKLVTEASMHVAGFERREGMIRQKIKSRKLMLSFNTEKQFNCW